MSFACPSSLPIFSQACSRRSTTSAYLYRWSEPKQVTTGWSAVPPISSVSVGAHHVVAAAQIVPAWAPQPPSAILTSPATLRVREVPSDVPPQPLYEYGTWDLMVDSLPFVEGSAVEARGKDGAIAYLRILGVALDTSTITVSLDGSSLGAPLVDFELLHNMRRHPCHTAP